MKIGIPLLANVCGTVCFCWYSDVQKAILVAIQFMQLHCTAFIFGVRMQLSKQGYEEFQ
jgi:hypothetical protein